MGRCGSVYPSQVPSKAFEAPGRCFSRNLLNFDGLAIGSTTCADVLDPDFADVRWGLRCPSRVDFDGRTQPDPPPSPARRHGGVVARPRNALPVVSGRSHGGSGWGGYPRAEDDAAWRQIYRHADWLGLDFCRVEVEQRSYEPERNQFTWDSPDMKISPVLKVRMKAGKAAFGDEVPAMSLTIYSTYDLGVTDKASAPNNELET